MNKIMIAAFSLVVLIIGEICRELSSFRVVSYRITSQKLKGINGKKKIVFLSDLHGKMYGEGNKRLLNSIREISPDMILIGGDMLVGKNGFDASVLFPFYKELSRIAKVYYANGNHEQRMKEHPERYSQSFAEYREKVQQCGIEFVENQSVEWKFGETDIKLTGLEIPLYCYKRLQRVEMETDQIEKLVGKSSGHQFQILMAHNPAYMKEYINWGADLIMGGHLHGGIARIPGIAGVISPAFDLFPKYSGDHYKEGETDIVVSKGLGTHTINIRFFNPAEIVVLELEEEKREVNPR